MPYLGSTPNASFSSRTKQDFTANGSTTAFTLSSAVASANDIEVFVGNVRQEPTEAYTVNGTTLTMSAAPANGINFYVVFKGLEENSVVPADGSISSAKIASGAVSSSKLDTNIAISGNLAVDTNVLHVDSTNNRVGINTTTGPEALNISGNGNLRFQTTDTVRIEYLNSSGAYALGTTGGAAIGFNRPAAGDDEIFFETHNGGVSHAERMRINKDGYVTTPSQPRFHAYKAGSAFTGGISGNEIFPFDNTTLNVGNHFNTSNYRFTAPVAGTYFFGCHLRSAISGETRVVRIMLRKNGTQQWDLASIGGGASPNISGGDHMGLEGSTIINAAANDYFDLQVSSELSISGTMYFDGGTRTNFYGFLIA